MLRIINIQWVENDRIYRLYTKVKRNLLQNNIQLITSKNCKSIFREKNDKHQI